VIISIERLEDFVEEIYREQEEERNKMQVHFFETREEMSPRSDPERLLKESHIKKAIAYANESIQIRSRFQIPEHPSIVLLMV